MGGEAGGGVSWGPPWCVTRVMIGKYQYTVCKEDLRLEQVGRYV